MPGLVVSATLTVTVTLTNPLADSVALGMLGAKETPAAEADGNTKTCPVNPLKLVSDTTAGAEEPAWTVRDGGNAVSEKSGLGAIVNVTLRACPTGVPVGVLKLPTSTIV